MLMMEDKKRRCAKTTSQQYMLYLEELESNLCFRTNKFSPGNPDIIQSTWQKLTIALNSTGGPQKDMVSWKKIFTDWKSAVRKRARQIKVNQIRTGGGPPEKPLGDLENKLLDILGTVTIDGLQDVQEIGIPNISEQHDENQSTLEEDTQLKTASLSIRQTNSPILENLKKRKHPETPKTEKETPKRKNNTVYSSFQNILNDVQTSNNVSTVLTQIDNHLRGLVEIEEKRYNLELQKLKLKYPDADL